MPDYLATRRIVRILRVMFVVLMASVANSPGAVEVDGLYRAEVPVAGKSAKEREEAVGRALAAVIVKVTGRRDARNESGLAQAFERPSAYLQQYRYGTVMQPDATGTLTPAPTLSVTFDQKAINGLLESSSLPIWSRIRPATLLWLAVEANSQRTLLGPQDASGLAEIAVATARARGVPVLLPLLDLEDRASLSAADVWGGFTGVIERASVRYGAGAILVGRIAAQPDGAFVGRWTLLIDAVPLDWDSEGADAVGAIAEGLEGAADRLGLRFSNISGGINRVRFKVHNVDTLEDYARVSSYFEGLDIVEAVAVTAAKGSTVSYELSVRGGRVALAQVLGLGRTLEQDPSDATLSTYTLRR